MPVMAACCWAVRQPSCCLDELSRPTWCCRRDLIHTHTKPAPQEALATGLRPRKRNSGCCWRVGSDGEGASPACHGSPTHTGTSSAPRVSHHRSLLVSVDNKRNATFSPIKRVCKVCLAIRAHPWRCDTGDTSCLSSTANRTGQLVSCRLVDQLHWGYD